MYKIITIGETLIDFTAMQCRSIKDVISFEKNPGGAPANVAVCAARLGGEAQIITKLANDGFGDYLESVLNDNNVKVSPPKRAENSNTALAFVALNKDGEREFMFYRDKSADLMLDETEITEDIFTGGILHFCSLGLVDFPIKYAHVKAIKIALEKGMLISFDPNLRHAVWGDTAGMLKTVREFIPYCHILKVSKEELREISGIDANEQEQVKSLFGSNVKCILVTYGAGGAAAYFDNSEKISAEAIKTVQIDSTGAGDTFIGTFLFCLQINRITPGDLLNDKHNFVQYLKYANKAAALCITKRGAIPAMPFYDEVFN